MEIEQALIASLEKAMKETIDEKIGDAVKDFELNVGYMHSALAQNLESGAKSAMKEVIEQQVDFSRLITKELITTAMAAAIKEIVEEQVDVSKLITQDLVKGTR
ncbi:hypothetical protein OF122_03670 [Pelagibacterium flavum]|uniref:Phasin domain-containing protein n=1 Tax=Pelagibacterium flavum TaxID=2984530 RepID=A0ABY6IUN4_9HYPH|nr:hypothetical protein [Pelagibacterium sp. YIM 151497]UYQ72885.1 hypothetical protein OF122_03670 [Pelagibacterium sp. YIM 151497]